ncbi:MarR family winged helix-turn-helix transcriptional regulator [Streptococcus hillyeri]|uniref:MarR family transcriptional regulator n=1 Tax=Streptococcus hillyeri TaxID=2282420 RepID=A0A3L9DQ66_9STRE|nr:MarR family winged helix-turn-helix transcriptional regulator [Streptococcus hillyeri]RLY02338.1 MarR family transcriptional regulator [Streptococcus hillyeri]
MGHFISDIRNVLNQLEQVCEDIAKEKGIEHLAGPQGWALIYLHRCSDQEIFVKDIEKELKISKSVASNLVKRMEKNGFIEIIPSKIDKRYKQVVLTVLGRDKVGHLGEFHQELHNSLFQNIEREDFKTVLQWAEQLKVNIENYKNQR